MQPRSVAAGHGWSWITRGFRLFMKSPAIWLALLVIMYASSKLLLYIPILGVVFVLLMPVFIVGLMDGCRALENGEALELGHLVRGFRKNAAQLVTIGGISLVGNLAVVMIVIALGGEAMSTMAKTLSQNPGIAPQVTEEMRAATSTIGRALLLGTIVSLPLLMALWFAPLLVYFNDLGPLAAMKSSFVACLRNALPMLVYGLAILAGMFLAMPVSMALGQYDLALWLLAPIVLPSLYVSYKDIFAAGTTQEMDPVAR